MIPLQDENKNKFQIPPKKYFYTFQTTMYLLFLTMFSLNMPSQSRFCNSWVITEVTLPGFNPCVNHNMSHDISFVRHFFETIRTTITTSVKFNRLCCITLQDEKTKQYFKFQKFIISFQTTNLFFNNFLASSNFYEQTWNVFLMLIFELQNNDTGCKYKVFPQCEWQCVSW